MYNIHNVKNISLSLQLKNLCNDTPWYIKGFASSLDSYAPSTRYSYVLTITTFLDFVHSSVPAYESFDRKHMPVSVFRSIPLELFDSYLQSLHVRNTETKEVSSLYLNRIIAAFKAFYQYLETQRISYTCTVSETKRRPVVRIPRHPISEKDILRLIDGVKRNDTYLLQDGSSCSCELIPIPDEALLRRERTISRNVSILSLLSYDSLSVIEIVGLDIDSINWADHPLSVMTPSGDVVQKPCSDTTLDALRTYLHAPDVPADLFNGFSSVQKEEILDFCKKIMTNVKAADLAQKKFQREDPSFADAILTCCHYLRNSGRRSFAPHPYDRALFLSTRSKRISVRMIEHMVKVMLKTYLPELCASMPISVKDLSLRHLTQDPR